MKKTVCGILLMCLLLSGCGRERYAFTCIDGESASPCEMEEGDTISGKTLVYTADGRVFYAEDYALCEPLAGVIKDPPGLTVMDTASLARKKLDAGERVLIIYIDGLGYLRYEKAARDGVVPNLASLKCEKAASMFPTITPVNYAAMVTGRCPAETGVTRRGIHTVSCETVFDYASAKGIESYISEGDSLILTLNSANTELSPDLNGSGTGDDEIFDCAMENLDRYDLVFVHFHSVDDASHNYGPESEEARAALCRADEWCGELLDVWDGAVIITADHGQHTQDGTGDEAYADRRGTHGDFAPSDIFVPFLTR